MQLLERSDLPRRKRMAIIVRLGEKRLLQSAIEKVNEEYPEGAVAPSRGPAKKRKNENGVKTDGKKSKK